MQKFLWFYENDRFIELLFCFFYSSIRRDAPLVRAILLNLKSLNLLQVAKLCSVDEKSNKNGIIIGYVLEEHGLEKREVTKSLELLTNIAKVFERRYRGKIQILLRHYGDIIRNEMIREFSNSQMTPKEIRYREI
jgi:hypothetical protein